MPQALGERGLCRQAGDGIEMLRGIEWVLQHLLRGVQGRGGLWVSRGDWCGQGGRGLRCGGIGASEECRTVHGVHCRVTLEEFKNVAGWGEQCRAWTGRNWARTTLGEQGVGAQRRLRGERTPARAEARAAEAARAASQLRS